MVPHGFVLFTDHIALKYLNTQKKLNSRHVKWVSFLQGYTFFVQHKSTKQNQVVDALSRRATLLTTMETEVTDFDAIKAFYETDDDLWEIVEQIKASSSRKLDHVKGDYFMQNGYLLRVNNYVYQADPCGKTLLGNFKVVDQIDTLERIEQ